MKVSVPYGRSFLSFEAPDGRLRSVLTSRLHELKAGAPEKDLVRASLNNPIGSAPLRDLAKGKKNVVIISSDHTRPVPSAVIMPLLLEDMIVRARASWRGTPSTRIWFLRPVP